MVLQVLLARLQQLNASSQIVSRPYTPALQDIQMMQSLYKMDIPPLDWIIVADTDELYSFGTATLREAIAQMEAEGATYALGEMLDHVSSNGSCSQLKVHGRTFSMYSLLLLAK